MTQWLAQESCVNVPRSRLKAAVSQLCTGGSWVDTVAHFFTLQALIKAVTNILLGYSYQTLFSIL